MLRYLIPLLATLPGPAWAYCPPSGTAASCPDSGYVMCSYPGGQLCGDGKTGWACYRGTSCPCGTRALRPSQAGGGGYAPIAPSSAAPTGTCAEAPENSPVAQAFIACDRMLAACSASDAPHAIAALEGADFCFTQVTDPTARTAFQTTLCADPAGFACSTGGRVVDSRCHLSTYNVDDFARTPEGLQVACEMWRARIAALPEDSRADCERDRASAECHAAQLARYDEVRQAERDAIYTPDRNAEATRLMTRVRDQYLTLIQGSTLIPDANKQALIDQLNNTRIQEGGLCSNTDLDEADWPKGAFFWSGSSGNTIEVCIGTMGNLERMNPYNLMFILAHELSHAIDPCRLEEQGLAADPSAGTPNQVDTVFPGLARCLRGGTGTRGCTNAIIHCNEVPADARRHACEQEASQRSMGLGDRTSGSPSEPAVTACLTRLERLPSCHIHGHHTQNVSQLPESFADFMGAEVMGRLIEADFASGALDEQGRIDALASIAASDGSGGGSEACESANRYETSDRYARGHTRVNRLLMGSRAFRSSLGCPADTPPSTTDAGVTCAGF